MSKQGNLERMYFLNVPRRDIEKQRKDVNTRLKNFCKQKNLSFIDKNLKDEHLGLKKLHLNRIGNSIFAKNFLSYLENN